MSEDRPERNMSPKEIVSTFAPGVAHIEVEDAEGNIGSGTAFHIGSGLFVTARHVVNERKITQLATTLTTWGVDERGWKRPLYPGRAAKKLDLFPHPDENIDVMCIETDLRGAVIELGIHTDNVLDGTSFALEPVVVMGYPPIPFASEPVLVSSQGEVNACFRPRGDGSRPHFVISPMARGGFSGGPAILANGYCLGIVTTSFIRDGKTEEAGYFSVLTVEPIVEALRHHLLVPEEQEHITELYDLLAYAAELRDERRGKRPRRRRPPSFIVSAWNGIDTTCAFDVQRDKTKAIARAKELAREHEGGQWTVFRVYNSNSRTNEPVHVSLVKNARPRARRGRSAE